jgi:hypothetical protein
MLQMTRPVIDFLNAIDWENPQVTDGTGELEQIAVTAQRVPVAELPAQEFSAPTRGSVAPPPKTSSIQYRRLVDDIERAKELLGVTTNSEVGQLTFDYYLDAES